MLYHPKLNPGSRLCPSGNLSNVISGPKSLFPQPRRPGGHAQSSAADRELFPRPARASSPLLSLRTASARPCRGGRRRALGQSAVRAPGQGHRRKHQQGTGPAAAPCGSSPPPAGAAQPRRALRGLRGRRCALGGAGRGGEAVQLLPLRHSRTAGPAALRRGSSSLRLGCRSGLRAPVPRWAGGRRRSRLRRRAAGALAGAAGGRESGEGAFRRCYGDGPSGGADPGSSRGTATARSNSCGRTRPGGVKRGRLRSPGRAGLPCCGTELGGSHGCGRAGGVAAAAAKAELQRAPAGICRVLPPSGLSAAPPSGEIKLKLLAGV